MPTSLKTINSYRWSLILLILLSTILRFSDLGSKCFWRDEAFSYEVCLEQRYDDSTPMLFYNICKPFLNLPFSPEVNGRLLSALFGVLTVWIIFLIARNILPGKYALLVGFLSAVNPVLIQLSQELRAYGMLTFIIALSILSAIRIKKMAEEEGGLVLKSAFPWLVLFIISGMIGLYTHYIMIPFLFCLLLVFAFTLLKGSSKPKDLKYLLLSYLIIAVSFMPHISKFLYRLSIHAAQAKDGLLNPFSVKVLVKSFWGMNLGYIFKFAWIKNPSTLADNLVYAVLLISASILILLFIKGFVHLIKSKSYLSALPIGYILFLLMYFITELSDYRQMIPVIIAHILILGVGIITFTKWKRFVGVLLVVIASGGALIWYYSLPYPPFHQADWRKAAEYLDENVKPKDVVFAACSDLDYLTMDFYYDGELVPFDDKVKLYHTSPEHTKRTNTTYRKLMEKAADKLNLILQNNHCVYVLLGEHSDIVIKSITSGQQVTSKYYGENLLIQKYVN
ncbi:MAG: glycosyltransferase family 39 protein [candidate division Zixibacteria bacterium]|nr:glycosyltransferase family 39 protein [Candidatus Tariuqbacter arcticus]